jgi:hypothetical protein
MLPMDDVDMQTVRHAFEHIDVGVIRRLQAEVVVMPHPNHAPQALTPNGQHALSMPRFGLGRWLVVQGSINRLAIRYSPIRVQSVEPYFAKMSTRASTNCEFSRMSKRDSVPV